MACSHENTNEQMEPSCRVYDKATKAKDVTKKMILLTKSPERIKYFETNL